MILRCIAVDDEPLALGLVSAFIEKTPFLTLVGKYSSAIEALTILQAEPIDLVFLDIQMPDINGLQFYKSLTEKPAVVFTTAYKDFAVEGFNVDAVDYLLKPFEYDRFLKAAYKAKEYL
ncbi:MAG: response regulator, partial [Runella slithyformis]